MKFRCILLLIVLLFNFSCKLKTVTNSTIDLNNLENECEQKLSNVLVHDIVNPLVASRIYAYANIAFYEGVRLKDSSSNSLLNSLHGFNFKPQKLNSKSIDENFVAVSAFFKVSIALCFSKDSVQKEYDYYLNYFKENLNNKVFAFSLNIGDSIAQIILDRASKDNYKYTRGLPRYSVLNNDNKEMMWEQTPPDYADAVEPNWGKIKTLFIDSASQFPPIIASKFGSANKSLFSKEINEVYAINKNRTLVMDTIALFWDDNAFITLHKGHFTAATKKLTPVGHWMSIVGILNKNNKADKIKSAYAYAITASSIFDGFIVCWYEKYKSLRARPITMVRKLIDPNWNSFLQTPAFPEYTSGHSVISNAASTVIASVFNNTSFKDSSENNYIGLVRNYDNVKSAAEEASISRLYGGIHFRSGVENGAKQGIQIGEFYTKNLMQINKK